MKTALTGVRAEFRRATDEREFRDWSFRETCDQARIAILVVPVLVMAGLSTDLVSMGLRRTLLLAFPVRLLFLALGVFEFTRLRRMTRIESVDRAVTLLQAFLFLVLYYFVALGYLSSTEHLLVALFIVLASYLVFPNRFVTMVRLGIFGGLGYVIAVAVFFGLEAPVVTFAGGVTIANVFGAITAHRLHVAKRREYLRLIEQRHLNEELRALNSDLEALATTDSLTGINNRRNFFTLAADELSRAKRYQRPLTALMIDVDGFKIVNDKHGHSAGDKVLKAVVQCCITTLRETDVLGRLGGDEFAILLPETGDGQDQADRLRRTVERLRTTLDDGTDLILTVSIGVASVRPEDESIDDVVARADEALYEAKQSGRNRVATA
jgi:diguanylate cyclase (GGDEF)-like protein